MKIRKRAHQKNFVVDNCMNSEAEIDFLKNLGIIENLFDDKDSMGRPIYRIFTCYCEEVKVVLVDGYYETVVITKEGFKVFVHI